MSVPNDYQWSIIRAFTCVLGSSWWHSLSEDAQKRILDNIENTRDKTVTCPECQSNINIDDIDCPTCNLKFKVSEVHS